ncbi:MAG: NAD(P)/FAD-dependent oxidoreductase [Sandaracinaceae bacterium]|nr:NAD(P)/FAD-dependent oxidoreductase [Sandaracinaceae bacterium]
MIIGSGFAGIGAAIRLLQEGERDFVVLERASDVGGVWRDNTYPGCACDVQSHLYELSFAPNPSWSRAYSPQAEIQDYLRGCATRFGVMPHVRFSREVTGARWEAASARWIVETSEETYTASFLVLGTGALADPAIPSIEGLDRFAGPAFHSARWRHDVDLEGKRVAVIGTGASAIQFVPAIQPRVAELRVFQRTPPGSSRARTRPCRRGRAACSSACRARTASCTTPSGSAARRSWSASTARPRRASPSGERSATSSAPSPIRSCARSSRRATASAVSASS